MFLEKKNFSTQMVVELNETLIVFENTSISKKLLGLKWSAQSLAAPFNNFHPMDVSIPLRCLLSTEPYEVSEKQLESERIS